MRNNKNIFLTLVISALLTVTFASTTNAQKRKAQSDPQYTIDKSDFLSGQQLIKNIPSEPLSNAEREGILMMREEEKLARDVYTELGRKWGLRIFSNIARSEQTHMDAIRYLIEKYKIQDPVTDDAIGKFTSKKMKRLYEQLTAQGMHSLAEALKVGATIEDLDIKDLEKLLLANNNEDIRITYKNLTKGSRNHLRAFVRQLSRYNEKYEPQFISPDEFKDIISSPHERGMILK